MRKQIPEIKTWVRLKYLVKLLPAVAYNYENKWAHEIIGWWIV